MRSALAFAAAVLLLATPAVAAAHKNETIPLSKYEKSQELLNKAGAEMSLLSIDVRASTKEYEHDVWAGVGPAKARVSCVRFKSSSGFQLKIDVPKFTASGDTLTIDQRIRRISADGLHSKFQLGPCIEHSTGFGFVASDIHFIVKAKSMLAFDSQGRCTLRLGDTGNINVKIGDFNARGVQNDLDKLVKKWAEHSIEAALNQIYSGKIGPVMTRMAVEFCGKG